MISLDSLSADERFALEPAAPAPAERLYDLRWAWTVMDQALDRVRLEYERADKADVFALLQPLLGSAQAGPSRADIAARLGVSVGAVDVALHRLRRRYGEAIREVIADTVSDPDEVDGEIRHLRAVLSG